MSMPAGTDGGVEMTALDGSWLQSWFRSRKTVTALHVYLTVGHPGTEWKLCAGGHNGTLEL